MKTGKKKKTGLIIAIVLIVLVLAAGGVFAWHLYSQALAEKQLNYEQAEAYLAEGDYRSARRNYILADDYADAPEKLRQVETYMADKAMACADTAQKLSDMGFNTLAGLYLTQALEAENQFTLTEYNDMASWIGQLYDQAAQAYSEAMTIDDKPTKTIMEDLMPRIEALEESRDPQDALQVLSELTTFTMAEQVFLHCWENGTLSGIPLETLAEKCPVWTPVMDQVIAADETLDILALVGETN